MFESKPNPVTTPKETAEQAIRRIIHICEARRSIAISAGDPVSASHNEEIRSLAEMALRNLLT